MTKVLDLPAQNRLRQNPRHAGTFQAHVGGDLFEKNHTVTLLDKPGGFPPVAWAGDVVVGQIEHSVRPKLVPQFYHAIPQRDAAILQVPAFPPQCDAFDGLPYRLLQFFPIPSPR